MSDNNLKYLDVKSRFGLLMEPPPEIKKMVTNQEELDKQNEVHKKLLSAIEGLLKRLETIFNKTDDQAEQNTIALEIKNLQEHKESLINRPSDIIANCGIYRSVAGISQAINIFESALGIINGEKN